MGRSGVAFHTALARRGCNRKETLVRRRGKTRTDLRGSSGRFKVTGNLPPFLIRTHQLAPSLFY